METFSRKENIEQEPAAVHQHSKQELQELGLYKRDAEYEIPQDTKEWIALVDQKLRQQLKDIPELYIPEQDTHEKSFKEFDDTIRSVMRQFYEYRGKKGIPLATEGREKEHQVARQIVAIEKLFVDDIDTRDNMTMLHKRDKLLSFLTHSLLTYEGTDRRLVVQNTDIDFFKSYNEAFGHDFGNIALETVALKLHEFIKQYQDPGTGVAARVGGEELTEAYLKKQQDTVSTFNAMKDLQQALEHRGVELLQGLQRIMGDKTNIREAMFDILVASRPIEVNNEINQNQQSTLAKIIEQLKDHPGLSESLHNLEPTELYTEITRLLQQNTHPEYTENLLSAKEELIHTIPLGTETIGFVEVDLSKSDSKIITEDAEYIYNQLNSTQPYVRSKAFDTVFAQYIDPDTRLLKQGTTYMEFKTVIQAEVERLAQQTELQKADPEKVLALSIEKVQWERLLENVYKRRAGRLMTMANEVQEKQKLKKRATVGVVDERDVTKLLTLEEVDKGFGPDTNEQAEDPFRVAFSTEQNVLLRTEYQNLARDLLALRDEKNTKAFDKRLRMFQLWRSVFVGQNKQQQERIEGILTAQAGSLSDEQVQEYQQQLRIYEIPPWFDQLTGAVEGMLVDNQKDRFFDPLTRSKNERYMLEVENANMQKAIENDRSYSFASLDMDNLKAINEVAGHFVGDIVLMKFAKTCETYLDKLKTEQGINSSFIRVTGGEEFGITFDSVSSSQATKYLTELNAIVKEEVKNLLTSYVVDAASNTTVYDKIQEYMRTVLKRPEKDLDKIGTVTAGVVDVRDLDQGSFKTDKGLHIGDLRQLADLLGEKWKQTQGRGVVVGLQDLQGIQ